jgi:hypothetical protein
MSQFIQRIDNLGRREATSLATATTQRVFGTLGAASTTNRQAINLTNCDASAELYVTFTAAGAPAPTISATDNDLIIPPKVSRQLQLGASIEVWIRQSGSGTINYTALELL